MYLLVNDINDIRKLEGRMSLKELLKGIRLPNKRKVEEAESSQIVN